MIYKHFISLGYNCETGLALRRFGYDESSIFRFTYVKFDSMLQCLQQHFKDFFLFDNIVAHADNMVRDTRYDVIFHSKMISKEKNGIRKFLPNHQILLDIYKQEYQKIQYLIDKWNTIIAHDEPVLYIVKPDRQLLQQDILQLYDTLKSYGSSNFEILILCKEEWSCEFYIDGVYYHVFSYFAPIHDTHAVDEKNWKKIYARYIAPSLTKEI